MADTYFRGNRTQIRQCATLVVRLYGLPAPGVHVGLGLHVDMPASFTPQRINAGWTSMHRSITRRLHPTNDDWGCLLDDEAKARFADLELRAQLTTQQQNALTTLINNSVPLDALWNNALAKYDNPLESNESGSGSSTERSTR